MSELSLERGIEALRNEVDASVAAFFSSCVHCGICAQACPFYVETGDPVERARVDRPRLDLRGHAAGLVNQRVEVRDRKAAREMMENALSSPIAGQPVVYERHLQRPGS